LQPKTHQHESMEGKLLRSAPRSPSWLASTMASIPEDADECPAQAHPKVGFSTSSQAFKAAVEESLLVECESPCGDALAHCFEEAARNTGRRGSEAGGLFWSEDPSAAFSERPATRPGRRAVNDGPCRPRSVLSMRVTLHNALPDVPGSKGLTAVVSIERPEGARPRLRFYQGAKTLASLVLDDKSIKVSLVVGPCAHAQGGAQGGARGGARRGARGGGPGYATEWLKLTCEEGGGFHGDIYAHAAMGWRALLPHLYQ
jgi:hypothetical protein